MLVAALFGHDRVPQHALRGPGPDDAFEVGEGHALPGEDGHLLVLEKHDVARVAQDGGDVRRHEELAVPEPDDDRRPVADGHDLFRIVGRHEHEREQPAHAPERVANGLLERSGAVSQRPRHEMRDHFGVGLGLELVAGRLELLLHLQVVFDDAVVDDHRSARVVPVRVRVLLGRPPVGGPARVAEPIVAGERRADQRFLEPRQLARAPPHFDAAVGHDGDTRRIVAPVFEPAEAFDQDWNHLFAADVANDAAHDDCSPHFAALIARRFSAHPGLFSCRLRAMPSAPGGTSRVMDDPAAT